MSVDQSDSSITHHICSSTNHSSRQGIIKNIMLRGWFWSRRRHYIVQDNYHHHHQHVKDPYSPWYGYWQCSPQLSPPSGPLWIICYKLYSLAPRPPRIPVTILAAGDHFKCKQIQLQLHLNNQPYICHDEKNINTSGTKGLTLAHASS